MYNSYYNKFIDFLKRHNLYDEHIFRLFREYYTTVEFNDDSYVGVPCVPYIVDDKTVLYNIYAYINTFLIAVKKNDNYNNNLYHRYMLPLFYNALYVKENQNLDLLEYMREQKEILLNDDSLNYRVLLENVELLVNEYEKGTYDVLKVMKRTKRLAKKCMKDNKK